MKTTLCRSIFIATWLASLAFAATAQDAAPEKPDARPPAKALDRAALEKQFEQTMTRATFDGRWCSVKDGKMGEERPEKYTIQSARKVGGDVWVISARIQFGAKDVTMPLPVNVLWAGDTAVISLTDLAIPNIGTYSARVLVHENTYAGTWSGGDHGGLLNGLIKHEQP